MTQSALLPRVRLHQSAPEFRQTHCLKRLRKRSRVLKPMRGASMKTEDALARAKAMLARSEEALAHATAMLAESEALLAKRRTDDIFGERVELNLRQPSGPAVRWVTMLVPASEGCFSILRHNVAQGPTARSTQGSLDSGVSGRGYTKLQLVPALLKLAVSEGEIALILKSL
jgi:hypothetical protein